MKKSGIAILLGLLFVQNTSLATPPPGSYTCGADNFSCPASALMWLWRGGSSSAQGSPLSMMAYDRYGTLRPLCASRSGSDSSGEFAAANIGLQVVDRAFPTPEHYGQCEDILTGQYHNGTYHNLYRDSHERCLGHQWVPPGQTLTLNRDLVVTGLDSFNGDVNIRGGFNPVCLCESFAPIAPVDEKGQSIPTVGLALASGSDSPCANVLCNLSPGLMDRATLNILAITQCNDRVERLIRMDNPVVSPVLGKTQVTLDAGASGLGFKTVISADESWQAGIPKPCIAQTTGSWFNLGTEVNRINVLLPDGSNTLFPGGCVYSNTGGSLAFYDPKYIRFSLPDSATYHSVSPAQPASDELWDNALYAGEKLTGGTPEKLYICMVVTSNAMYFGRALKNTTACHYGAVETYPSDGSGLKLIAAQSQEFFLVSLISTASSTEPATTDISQITERSSANGLTLSLIPAVLLPLAILLFF